MRQRDSTAEIPSLTPEEARHMPATLDRLWQLQNELPEPHREATFALFRDATQSGMTVVAPYLMPVEVTNVVWKRMRDSALSLAAASERLGFALSLPIDLREPAELHQRA